MEYSANTSHYEKSKIDKEHFRRKVKSPNVGKMYGIRIKKFRITYYYTSKNKRAKKLRCLLKETPDLEYLLIK